MLLFLHRNLHAIPLYIPELKAGKEVDELNGPFDSLGSAEEAEGEAGVQLDVPQDA